MTFWLCGHFNEFTLKEILTCLRGPTFLFCEILIDIFFSSALIPRHCLLANNKLYYSVS